MSNEKKHFFVRLVPPRPTFLMDITDQEREIMQRHVVYWGKLLEDGIAIAYGPVMDPNGGYGIGVVCVNGDHQLQRLIAEDPATGLTKYEYAPMRAYYKGV